MSLVASTNSGGGRPVCCFALLAVALVAGALPMARAQAQQQSARPTVAAASARWLCLDAACRSFPEGFVDDPTHYICDNCNMWTMILPAYGIKVFEQFQDAPQWFADDYYQVHIAASAPVASRAQMEQSLLREVLVRCFSLRVRRVVTRVPGYALVVAPGGVKFRRVSKAVPGLDMANRVVHYANVAQLVLGLNQYYYDRKRYGVTRPVHDATGLTGTYDIPVPLPEPGTGTNLLAVIGRLGLEAKPAPGLETRFDVLHVDHLRKSCEISGKQ